MADFTSLLGRDAGFTGRSLLWEQALELIKQKPLLGWGNDPEIIQIWGGYFSSHNQLLDIAARGGLLTLFLYICLHIYVFLILGRIPTTLANIFIYYDLLFSAWGLDGSWRSPYTVYIYSFNILRLFGLQKDNDLIKVTGGFK